MELEVFRWQSCLSRKIEQYSFLECHVKKDPEAPSGLTRKENDVQSRDAHCVPGTSQQ